jgi:hypothetical protein
MISSTLGLLSQRKKRRTHVCTKQSVGAQVVPHDGSEGSLVVKDPPLASTVRSMVNNIPFPKNAQKRIIFFLLVVCRQRRNGPNS